MNFHSGNKKSRTPYLCIYVLIASRPTSWKRNGTSDEFEKRDEEKNCNIVRCVHVIYYYSFVRIVK